MTAHAPLPVRRAIVPVPPHDQLPETQAFRLSNPTIVDPATGLLRNEHVNWQRCSACGQSFQQGTSMANAQQCSAFHNGCPLAEFDT